MSADKKTQTRAEREEKRRQEERKDRRSMVIYSVVGVVVLVAAVALLIGNSGILQRSLTALNVNGTKYTAADVQYYYSNLYTNWANRYAFNTGESVKNQVYDAESGQSWYDYLMEEATGALTEQTALAAKARSENFALPADVQTELDSTLSQLDSAWVGYGYISRDAFIRDRFGAHMTYDRLKSLIEMEYLATSYASAQLDAIQHSDADYDAYYQEHADELDTFTYSQFTFRASVPSTDSEGNPVELTDGEKAAQLEQLKTEQKALAEEVKAKLESGADPEKLAEEYKDQLYSSNLSGATAGTGLSYTPYADWLTDSARRSGDVTLSQRETDTAAYYYVARFEGRALDQENTNTVRHLLVRAGSGTADSTQAEYDEAEKKAQSLLDEWKAGEKTEDSFAALVTANSDDTGSASSGGLISGITSTSNYVEAFRDWATDPSRREGDTELVKTEYGWHVMYYVSSDEPVWRQNVSVALENQDYEQLAADASQGWTVSRGMGMNFVKA